MSEQLQGMMADGAWHKWPGENPPEYGEYTVIKRGRSRHLDYDRLLWNGGYWVTHGHGVCTSVDAWKEDKQ